MPDLTQNLHEEALKNEVFCEDNIVNFSIRATIDPEEALRLSTVGRDLIESCAAAYILIDLHQSKGFSSSARKIWAEFLKNDKIKRAAIFGGNVFVKTIATFVVAATGKKNVQFFDTKEGALAWIKEDQASA